MTVLSSNTEIAQLRYRLTDRRSAACADLARGRGTPRTSRFYHVSVELEREQVRCNGMLDSSPARRARASNQGQPDEGGEREQQRRRDYAWEIATSDDCEG